MSRKEILVVFYVFMFFITPQKSRFFTENPVSPFLFLIRISFFIAKPNMSFFFSTFFVFFKQIARYSIYSFPMLPFSSVFTKCERKPQANCLRLSTLYSLLIKCSLLCGDFAAVYAE